MFLMSFYGNDETKFQKMGDFVFDSERFKDFPAVNCAALISTIVIAGNFFKFKKRSQLFIRTHNETLSVSAMALCSRRNNATNCEGPGLTGTSIWHGAYESARSPITASPHRGVLAVAA